MIGSWKDGTWGEEVGAGWMKGSSRSKSRQQKELKPLVSRLSAERVGSPGAESFWEGPHSSLEHEPTKGWTPGAWWLKDSSCGSGWHSQEFIISGNLTEESPKVLRVELFEGLKQSLCTQLLRLHKLWRCLSGLCMEMEGLRGTVNMPDHSLLWYPCLPVPFQPLTQSVLVMEGDDIRNINRALQRVLLHQLQAVPNCGCVTPESLFQSPVSGC